MKSSITHVSDTRVKLTVTLDPEELEAARQVALKKLSNTVKVPGFRKGHVPLAVAAKHIDPNVLSQETLENALSRSVAEAYIEANLQALERPEVEITKYVPESELEFTAEADVLPEIKLGDYKKLKAEKQTVKVEKSDVDEVVDRIRQGYAEKKETKKAAAKGDEVIIDFVGKEKGEPFDGGKGTDYPLVLGSKSFIPGFEDALVGHKAGEKFTIPLTFPKNYAAANLAGKKVEFDVEIKRVNNVEVPELTDELAAKAGPYTETKELLADIKAEITARREQEATDKLKDDLIKQLVAKSEVPAPKVLVDDMSRSIEQDTTQNLMYRGMTLEQYFQTNGFKDREDWLEREVKEAAEARVKSGLVLAELSKAEAVDASAEELAEQINNYKTQYANNPDMSKRFDEPEVQREVANRLLTEKAINRLVELNTKK